MKTRIETKDLTYRKLIELLQALPEERLNDNVTILDECNGEFFPAKSFDISNNSIDVIDEGHFFITMQD